MTTREHLHDPLYLSPEQKEVWRVMPYSQQAEITRFTRDFSQGWSLYTYRPHNHRRTSAQRNLYTAAEICFSSVISNMVWQDLELAEGANFPEPTPSSAMLLARKSRDVGSILSTGKTGYEVGEKITACGTALTGLHMAVLGSRDLILSNIAESSLHAAARALHEGAFSKTRIF